ncbi:MAG: formylglycine-generating enzyme family protein [Kofleriaceae bacterium]
MALASEASVPFCIDVTEVDRASYDAFASAPPVISNRPANCVNDIISSALALEARPHQPVVGVDWCDAWAYCAAAGKRLCGRIGGGTFADLETDPLDPTQSEWHHVCTRAGRTAFPYGDTYVEGACSTWAIPGQFGEQMSTSDVGSRADCQGGIAGVYDLSGNVWEWVEECGPARTLPDGTVARGCRARGGSVVVDEPPASAFDQTLWRCDVDSRILLDTWLPANLQWPTIGFRCCADPVDGSP